MEVTRKEIAVGKLGGVHLNSPSSRSFTLGAREAEAQAKKERESESESE